jgi:hypothetical protein
MQRNFDEDTSEPTMVWFFFLVSLPLYLGTLNASSRIELAFFLTPLD